MTSQWEKGGKHMEGKYISTKERTGLWRMQSIKHIGCLSPSMPQKSTPPKILTATISCFTYKDVQDKWING